MGISSLGVGSGILTQDVLDQLRAADEAQRVRPITLNLANENDKKDSLAVIDASMTNFRDAINELKTATVFDGRKSTITGSSIELTASANSDLQDFTLNVTTLASKQLEQSGAFTASTDLVASGMVGTGTMTLNVGSGTPVNISYDGTTTLADLKKLINDNAGDQVDATIVQISATESRLFINAVGEGASNDISITDQAVGGGLDTKLTTGMDVLNLGGGVTSAGKDAAFTFNGQAITRSSNQVDDLITGYKLKLVETGSSTASVTQDRGAIETKIDSFVSKYNSIITELGKQTLSSTDSATRGIFSSDSSIKNMNRSIKTMIGAATAGGASMEDYGFSVDRDGKMTIDKTLLNTQLDANPTNVESFFTGGSFTKADSSVVTLTGAFSGFYDIVNGYTKTTGGLKLVKDDIALNITSLEDRKTSATERLDAKYAILKKQYAAYNSLINKFNSASSIFTQLANNQTNG